MLNNGYPSAMLANGVFDSVDIVELAVMGKGLKNSGIYDFKIL